MANKIQWVRTLSEVLGRNTEVKKFTSKKGTEYETECVPQLDAIVVGTPTFCSKSFRRSKFQKGSLS